MPRGEQIIKKDRIENIATKFLEINGSEGKVYFYNKDEKAKENIDLNSKKYKVIFPLGVYFQPGGFQKDVGGYYGSMSRDWNDDKVRVRQNNSKFKFDGTLAQLKDQGYPKGFKACLNIYFVNGAKEIESLKLYGASFAAWNDLVNKEGLKNVIQNAVKIAGWTDENKGAVKYKKPIFELIKVESESTIKVMDDIYDNQFKPWHDAYFDLLDNNNNFQTSENSLFTNDNEDEFIKEYDGDFNINEKEEELPF